MGGFSVDEGGLIRVRSTSRKGKDPSGVGCSMVKFRSSVRESRKER